MCARAAAFGAGVVGCDSWRKRCAQPANVDEPPGENAAGMGKLGDASGSVGADDASGSAGPDRRSTMVAADFATAVVAMKPEVRPEPTDGADDGAENVSVRWEDCVSGRAVVVRGGEQGITMATADSSGAVHGLKIVNGVDSKTNKDRIHKRRQVSLRGPATQNEKLWYPSGSILSVDISDGGGAPQWRGKPVQARAAEAAGGEGEGRRAQRRRAAPASEPAAAAPGSGRKRKRTPGVAAAASKPKPEIRAQTAAEAVPSEEEQERLVAQREERERLVARVDELVAQRDEVRSRLVAHWEDRDEVRRQLRLRLELAAHQEKERAQAAAIQDQREVEIAAGLPYVREMFVLFDGDKDSRLNKEEYKRYLQGVGLWGLRMEQWDESWQWECNQLCRYGCTAEQGITAKAFETVIYGSTIGNEYVFVSGLFGHYRASNAQADLESCKARWCGRAYSHMYEGQADA